MGDSLNGPGHRIGHGFRGKQLLHGSQHDFPPSPYFTQGVLHD